MKNLLQKYHDNFPDLVSDRLLLRKVNPEDADSLFKIFSDPDAMKYYNIYPFAEKKEVEQLIAIINEHFIQGVAIRWVIVLINNNEPIGTIGLSSSASNPFGAELGFDLNKNYWNRGIITEAIICVKNFGLNDLGLKRIQARTKPENTGSWKALEKAGFLREGLLRKQSYWKNEFHDVYLYSVIAN